MTSLQMSVLPGIADCQAGRMYKLSTCIQQPEVLPLGLQDLTGDLGCYLQPLHSAQVVLSQRMASASKIIQIVYTVDPKGVNARQAARQAHLSAVTDMYRRVMKVIMQSKAVLAEQMCCLDRAALCCNTRALLIMCCATRRHSGYHVSC